MRAPIDAVSARIERAWKLNVTAPCRFTPAFNQLGAVSLDSTPSNAASILLLKVKTQCEEEARVEALAVIRINTLQTTMFHWHLNVHR